ncbi:MAG: AsmA family protein [Rickettsiales endosymbiont of Dermacentor nuttalli]
MKLTKFVKYSGIFFSCIIIILLIIPFFIPLNSYKQFAINKVREATGRELKINGPISLSLLPIPSIKIKDIELESVEGAKHDSLLKAESISASVSILSLLQGNIEISSILIDTPILNLEQNKDGLSSWEFKKDQSTIDNTPQDAKITSSNTTNLSIGLIKITNGQLNYLDSTNTNTASTTVYIDDLEIKNFYGPNNLHANIYSNGRNYSISGNIQEKQDSITINMNLTAFKEKIAISGNFARENMSFIGQLNLEGNAKNLQDVLPSIKALGNTNHTIKCNINANQKLISFNDINLKSGNISASGNGSFSPEDKKINLRTKLNPGDVDITITSITDNSNNGISEKLSVKASALKPLLNELVIDLKDIPASLLDQALTLTTDLTYSDQNLVLNNTNLNIDKANLKGELGLKNWNKNLYLNYNLQIDKPEIFASLVAVNLPVNINDILVKGQSTLEQDLIKTNTTLAFAGSSHNIQGDIGFIKSITPNITIESTGTSLGNVIAQLTKLPPNNTLGKYSFLTKIHGNTSQSIKIDINKLDISLKNNPITLNGYINIDLASNKPKLESDIKVGSINLNSISTPQNIYSVQDNPHGSRSLSPWSSERIDLAFLKKFDGNLNLNIKQIIKDNLVLDDITANISILNCSLDIKLFRSKVFGGSLEGHGQISADGPVNLKVNLQKAGIKNFTDQKGTFKILNGIANLNADLKTTGHSQIQYINNLFGTVNISINSGSIYGFDLQKILNFVQNIRNPAEILQVFDRSLSGGETQFNDLTINSEIKNGIANINNSKLNAGRIEVITTGNINLSKYSCDINSIITLDNKKSYPPFTVHFYGNLDNVQHKIVLKDLQQYLINHVLDGIIKGQNPVDVLKNLKKNQNSDSTKESD